MSTKICGHDRAVVMKALAFSALQYARSPYEVTCTYCWSIKNAMKGLINIDARADDAAIEAARALREAWHDIHQSEQLARMLEAECDRIGIVTHGHTRECGIFPAHLSTQVVVYDMPEHNGIPYRRAINNQWRAIGLQKALRRLMSMTSVDRAKALAVLRGET